MFLILSDNTKFNANHIQESKIPYGFWAYLDDLGNRKQIRQRSENEHYVQTMIV